MYDPFSRNSQISLNFLAKRIACYKFLILIKKYIKRYFKTISKNVEIDETLHALPIFRSLWINVCFFELHLFVVEFSKYFNQNNYYKRYLVFRSIYSLKKKTAITILLVTKLSMQFQRFFDHNAFYCKFKQFRFKCCAKIFVIGVAGVRKDIFEVRTKIKMFTKNDLKCVPNSLKTIVVCFIVNPLFFSCMFVKKSEKQKKCKLIFNRKNSTSKNDKKLFKIDLKISIKVLFKHALKVGFLKKRANQYSPKMLSDCISLNNQDILRYYNFNIYSVFSFYSFLKKKKHLTNFAHYYSLSFARTLALKYKVRHASKIYKRLGLNLKFFLIRR
jgi:hypothetical protein